MKSDSHNHFTMSAKNAFFPWPIIQHETKSGSLFPRAHGPDSEIHGKPSQTALKNDQSLAQMFASALKKKDFYSEAPVIFYRSKVRMTFRALDEISSRMAKAIARIIEESKATPNSDGDTVLAFLLNEDSWDEKVITLIFATIKLGITYMALSPTSHPNDLGWALNVIKPVLLIDSMALPTDLKATLDTISKDMSNNRITFEDLWDLARKDNVTLDKDEGIAMDMNDPEVWGGIPQNQRIVSIFFTSGSSGSPHAVRIGGKEIINRIHWQSKIFPIVPSDAFAITSPLTDPRSLVQILTPLLSGKPVTLLSRTDLFSPDLLMNRIAEVKLTRVTLTPPCFEALMNYVSKNPRDKDKLASVTHWFVSGGRLKVEAGRKFFSNFSGVYKSGVFLVAFYGMTETLGEATFEVFFNVEDLNKKVAPGLGTLSMGVPITNSSVAILDRFDKTVPVGGRGEIALSGGCLPSGGYVGQGRKDGKSPDNQTNSKAELHKRHILFRTGDIGRILVDPSGVKRLHFEGRFDNEVIQTGGESVNLRQIQGEVMSTNLVTDATVVAYHRGRDTQVIIAAVVLRPEMTCVQVLGKLHTRKQLLGAKNSTNILPTVFAIDKIPLMENGRVDKKQVRILFRKILLECDPAEWKTLHRDEDGETVRFLCRAIALSTGLPLILVVRRFTKSFAELGGTRVNAIIVVKMCNDNGYPITMKDFITAKTIADLADVLNQSKKQPILLDSNNDLAAVPPTPSRLRNDFDGKFSFEVMSVDEIQKVTLFLKNDFPSHLLVNPQGVLKYWRGVVDSVSDFKMCIVAKYGINIVGVAINGDAQHKILTPKPPKEIRYGLELLNSCLDMSKYEMWRKSSGHVARCYFLGVTSSSNISPGEKVVLVEELLAKSCNLAKSGNFASFVITTANPVVQETAIHLLKFRPILEYPVSRFRSRDETRPFLYADDNHTASVLIKDTGHYGPLKDDDNLDGPSVSVYSTESKSIATTKSSTLGDSSMSKSRSTLMSLM